MPDPGPGDDAPVVGFTPEGARRVARAVARLERTARGGGVPPRPRYPVGAPVARVAQVGGTAIGMMTGSNPGSGAGTLYGFDGTTLTSADAITIYNLYFLCEITGGAPRPSIETSEIGFFAEDELPELSPLRVQQRLIHRMFAHHRQPDLPTEFD